MLWGRLRRIETELRTIRIQLSNITELLTTDPAAAEAVRKQLLDNETKFGVVRAGWNRGANI